MAYHSSARTKGYIRVEEGEMAGTVRKFQFNPERFGHERLAEYAESASPGIAYPLTQFIGGGARVFDVELFFWDKPCEGVIDEFWEFVLQLLPPEENGAGFERPPAFLFVYGSFIKPCVLEKAGIEVDEYDTDGNMVQARISLSCRQV